MYHNNKIIKREIKRLIKETHNSSTNYYYYVLLYTLPILAFTVGYAIGNKQQIKNPAYGTTTHKQPTALPIEYKIPDIEVIYDQGNPGSMRL